MKTHFFQFVLIINSIFIIALLSSCASNNMFTKEKKQYFDDVSKEANYYFQKGDYENAKKVLFKGIAEGTPQKSPELEFDITPIHEKNANEKMKPVAKVTTKNLVQIKVIESYQKLYHLLGKVYNNEKNYDKAVLYLDTCIYMRENIPLAWSDLILTYTLNHNYDKAKAVGNNGLNLFEKIKNQAGSSIIYRQLGYMAIQENDLIKAEEYYKKSLEYTKSDDANEQLEYIKTLKDKK
jgi:uncharacterized protein HemY